MATFEGTIKRRLTAEQRTSVRERIGTLAAASAVDRQATLNLFAESRVSSPVWHQLATALLAAEPHAESLRRAIRAQCRSAPRLRATRVRLDADRQVGRAVTMQALARMFVSLGCYVDDEQASLDLERAVKRPLDWLRASWARRDLGKFVMWSTFSTGDPDPFPPTDRSSDQIRCTLGLDRCDRGQPLVLLRYFLPRRVAGRYPTFLEAYAGDVWVSYFRPAPRSEPHGWTMTWDECSALNGRPEIVHTPITGRSLSAPLELCAP